MAGAGTVILGILAGGAAVGGTLVAADPLGARKGPAQRSPLIGGTGTANGPGEGPATEEWEHVGTDRPGEALAVFGYAPSGLVTPQDVRTFQGDVNEVLRWVRATKAGNERVPPAGAGFTSVPLVLQGIPAAPDLEVTGDLDIRTLMALGKILQVVTLTSGVECVTPQGRAIEASISACQGAWQQAHRYAYEANLTGTGTLWTS